MITNFISDNTFKHIDVNYPLDDDLFISSIKINVDGNLNYTIIPNLQKTKDIKINNYSINILSKNNNLNSFLDFKDELNFQNNLFYIYHNPISENENSGSFWKVVNDDIKLESSFFEIGVTNIFKIEFINESKCKIYHERNNLKQILTYSISLSSLKMVPLSSENISSYPSEFNYVLSENKIIFHIQTESGNYPIEKNGTSLLIKNKFLLDQNNSFYIKKTSDINILKNTNNWASYKNTFNKNNIELDQNKSYFDIKNNNLFTSTIDNITSSFKVNVLTLKNQLNQENDQSRGNAFLEENETTLKEYESIFTGGFREKGYDKINIGYTSYTTPFIFKSGKTTYFHVPHDIYPYEKLNINSSKLAESGAIGGNSPLNSDKIWKKLKNYKETSPYSLPQEENTGQWLCTWLSAGNPNTRPVWMDRYYKPSKTTPYVALSEIATEVIYKDSFECLNLKEDISDVKSSLTFEKGCYYAYMHLGENDYLNLIKESLSAKILYNNLDLYKKTNYIDKEKKDNEYIFDGKSFGYIESNKNIDNNNISFSFFLEKEDWNKPSGNLIFGNYVNNGFGFYNYILNTPYVLLKSDNNTLGIFNNSFLEIDNISTQNITLCSISSIARRSGFDNIHIFTEDFKIIEMDLKGTIVDSSSAIKDVLSLTTSDNIISTTNNENFAFISTSNGNVKIDLETNNVFLKSEKISIGSGSTYNIIIDEEENLYKIYAEQPIYRNTNIYCLSSNRIMSYSTTLSSLSTYIEINDRLDCFGITKENNFDIVSKNKILLYENAILKNTEFIPSIETLSLTAKQISYCEKFEYGILKKIKNIFCINSEEAYVVQIDENSNQNTIKLDKKYDIFQKNIDITNYNYNIQHLSEKYNENTYNFKIKLLNKVNNENFTELIFIINSKDLSTGKRHFVLSIDCYNGIAQLFLDGQLYESKKFDDKKYILAKTFNGTIFFGSNGFFNGIPAFKHLKDHKDFVCSDFILSDIYILNKAIDRYESLYFYSTVNPPNDLIYNMPSGTRNFIDSIEKFFNFNIPMFKSNHFDLKIVGSGIIYDDLKEKLSEHISEKIKDFLPINTTLEKIDWEDSESEVLFFNNNISNTLTNFNLND
jgi:hypothetical protein